MSGSASSLRPSPSQDVLQLVHSLGRAEWGPLAGPEFRGARIVLEALASIMWAQHRGRSATSTVTAKQIADRAAYSQRWTRASLHRLEDAGILEWRRGGVIDGAPQPGRFRIVKAMLCDWIEAARRRHDEAMARYIAETRKRLRALVYKTIRPRLRRSEHAEVTSNLPPYQGRRGAPRSAPSARNSSTPPRKDNPPMSTMTLDLLKMQTLPPEDFMPLMCGHGNSAPRFCNRCRYEGWTKKQEADALQQEEAARKRAEQRRREQADEEAKGKAFVNYMLQTYPDHRRSDWPDLINTDPTAKDLANA